jgi:predicted permease
MWGRRKREDFQAELDAHLQLEADQLRSEGAGPDAARDAARRALGNRASVEERFYDSSPWTWLEQAVRDLRYAARMLRKDAGFSALAIAVLALSIGGNTAVFSLVNAVLLKPLQIADPDQVVGCYSVDLHHAGRSRAFSYPNYADLRDRNPVFSRLAAHDIGGVGLSQGAMTRPVPADLVSSNFFDTLGVTLYKGRTFTPEEERPDSNPPVVILSYPFWKRYGADPGIVGKSLRLSGRDFTIVGVAPEGFTGTLALLNMDIYLPLGVYSLASSDTTHTRTSLSQRDNPRLMLVGRLKPGMTQRDANSLLAPIAAQMEREFPVENRDQTLIVQTISRLGLSPNPSTQSDFSNVAVPVILLMSMAAVVLSIASLNLASLMLARGNVRHREIAIRLAIGSGRSRIIRQLCTEGFLLASLGGATGLAAAAWGSTLVMKSLAAIFPLDLVYSPQPDVRVLAATLGFCLLSTVIFSLWPAWKISKPALTASLKTSAGEEERTGTRRLFSRRNVLVMAQLSLSLMMLSAAGLFVRSALRARNLEPGFDTKQELVAELNLSLSGDDGARGRQTLDRLLTRVRDIPGVESVALAKLIPFGKQHEFVGVRPAGTPPDSAQVESGFNSVTPEYFRTLGIPVLRGRTFVPAETGVAILDRLAAQRLWPEGDAIGRRVIYADKELQVVGVVGSVREETLGDNPVPPHVYVPFAQAYSPNLNVHLKLAASTPEAQARLTERIREEIRAVDDRVALLTVKNLSEHIASSADQWAIRIGAQMVGVFAAMAILLAVIGLYGVKAYTVARRTREIGIRMAIGANSNDVLEMILREGLLVTAIGVAAGLVLAVALGRVLSGILYDVGTIDALVLVLAVLLLSGVSAFASYLPARRAARVDPMIALRYD